MIKKKFKKKSIISDRKILILNLKLRQLVLKNIKKIKYFEFDIFFLFFLIFNYYYLIKYFLFFISYVHIMVVIDLGAILD